MSTGHWRPSGKIRLGAKVLYCPRRRTETPLLWGHILAIGVLTWSHCSVIVKAPSKESRKPPLVCLGFSLIPVHGHRRHGHKPTAVMANRRYLPDQVTIAACECSEHSTGHTKALVSPIGVHFLVTSFRISSPQACKPGYRWEDSVLLTFDG